MSEQPPKPDSDLDELRKRIGISEPTKVSAGAIGPNSFSDAQLAYEEEMRLLHEGGADYGGLDLWRFMRQRKAPK